ncbi:SWIM zinc finger family protein [Stieleria varia]|uniref:SWIM-type domain-containing protein n=1 Tax=Stieleria varia TaxID=2528005 RepID=A0A5C6AXF4_9BACT|nr:SWIM zinc finger family protein [Stieleria varia]TWU04410.1 hypothetical protein Pla52n_24500 [Stieleria varia]
MSLDTLEHRYSYRNSSHLSDGASGTDGQVILAPDRPFSFQGQFANSGLFCDALLCLSDIVRSNFAYAAPGMLDPVVTCDPNGVRFEGFSGCCGVYVTANFMEPMFDNAQFEFGTTNVDFNDDFRNGLSLFRQKQSLSLLVRHDAVELIDEDSSYREKKVKLPLRWLRGFCEVQNILARVEHRITCSSREVRKFLQGLPRNAARQHPLWIVPSGKGLRASTRETDQAVPLVGTDRLRLMEKLLRSHDGTISMGRIPDQATSSWFCEFGNLQFGMLLSPGIYRGFSGEGQVLSDLADESWKNAIDRVRGVLNWHENLDSDSLAAKLKLPRNEISSALTALATRGVLGYDLYQQRYFYRVMPFESSLVESLQPRLIAARKIVQQNRISGCDSNSDSERWIVQGSGVEHLVEVTQQSYKCSCIWYSKHKTTRGPCKHILAAMICRGEEA